MQTGSMEIVYGGYDSSTPITQPSACCRYSKENLPSLTIVALRESFWILDGDYPMEIPVVVICERFCNLEILRGNKIFSL